jgi:hypothetical protein
MDHPKTCICGGTGRIYDHVQDDTGTECPINYATGTDRQNNVVRQVPVADADMPEKVEVTADDIPGWTRYKFHVGVTTPPGTSAGNPWWHNWETTRTLRRVAFIEGLITGLGIGVGVAMMILAHWIK